MIPPLPFQPLDVSRACARPMALCIIRKTDAQLTGWLVAPDLDALLAKMRAALSDEADRVAHQIAARRASIANVDSNRLIVQETSVARWYILW